MSSTPVDSYWAAIFTSDSQEHPHSLCWFLHYCPYHIGMPVVSTPSVEAIALLLFLKLISQFLHQVKSYLKCFNSDPCSMLAPFTRHFIKAVKSSHVCCKRLQRQSREQEKQKRKMRKMAVENQPVSEKRMKLRGGRSISLLSCSATLSQVTRFP